MNIKGNKFEKMAQKKLIQFQSQQEIEGEEKGVNKKAFHPKSKLCYQEYLVEYILQRELKHFSSQDMTLAIPDCTFMTISTAVVEGK